ncbi:cytochrome c family protein [Alcanivorax hongdengensis A-11-3]|uniref:Cytochrome c family protein n=1 Tax=Alcanivorax hongdengensis A-11-3 TaxID=1177179 RepID=L0W8N6_9GAMM|nr:cytochrome c/FTR1 family iron permease [Alcanivorax hongdengensis]EKF73083.1 cytochrome c family protein [Alcanivorax hongdengensis A-11-3]
MVKQRGCQLLVGLMVMMAATVVRADQGALVQLVEYIGADYVNAVSDGAVTSADEYGEMQEFSRLLAEGIAKLPASDGKAELSDQAARLRDAVSMKAPVTDIKALTRAIHDTLVGSYGIPVMPRSAPDLARAKQLYRENCMACHGARGQGDGPAAAALEPAPTDFTDIDRYGDRSLLGLYTTISQGVEGTAMAAFAPSLSESDRWGLAFYVGSRAVSPSLAEHGKQALDQDMPLKRNLDLADVIARSPGDVRSQQGESAYAALGYLRSTPAPLFSQNRFIQLSADKLTEAQQAYQAGNYAAAKAAALSAYLDGFEMIEQQVAAMDPATMRQAESRFMAVREAIDNRRAPEQVSDRVNAAQRALEEAASVLGGQGLSPAATFSASFFILFREGLEALLVVAALLTFTRKAGAQRASRHIHYGWLAALLAGGLTWYLASTLITFSGASRELTEGVAGLIAAGILFYVGFWMHSNSNSQRWLGYIRDKVDSALGRGTVWTLAFVAFISVYREIFETILFYQALWTQVDGQTQAFLFYGIGAAVLALAVVSLLFFRVGMTLPLGVFFRVTSLVLLVLSVILLGKGIAALQEAGLISVMHLAVPTVDWLGVYPTVQGLLAQLLAVVLAVLLWWKGNRTRST